MWFGLIVHYDTKIFAAIIELKIKEIIVSIDLIWVTFLKFKPCSVCHDWVDL